MFRGHMLYTSIHRLYQSEFILQAQEERVQEDHIRVPPTLDQVSSKFYMSYQITFK